LPGVLIKLVLFRNKHFCFPTICYFKRLLLDIARSQREPFSTSENLNTLNCNEFILELYRQAIAEFMTESQSKDPKKFAELLNEYGDPEHAGQVRKLISSKTVEYTTGTLGTGLAVKAAELAGERGVTKEAKKKGEARTEFEGKLEMRNLYPSDWASSWNPFQAANV
jgi:hypothetical protein